MGRTVSISRDGTTRVWDFENGQTIRTLKGAGFVAVTGDGRRAAQARAARTLWLGYQESGQTLLHVGAIGTSSVPWRYLATCPRSHHVLETLDVKVGSPGFRPKSAMFGSPISNSNAMLFLPPSPSLFRRSWPLSSSVRGPSKRSRDSVVRLRDDAY
jgi:hypothetical protein